LTSEIRRGGIAMEGICKRQMFFQEPLVVTIEIPKKRFHNFVT
jgi:hypothetical protein